MKVKSGKCIRRLSLRSLWANRRRNLIAIAAIVLTTLLFTALFTVAMSINSSYETYQFRQIGGYSHGTFKEVTEEQAKTIAGHKSRLWEYVKASASLTMGYLLKLPLKSALWMKIAQNGAMPSPIWDGRHRAEKKSAWIPLR